METIAYTQILILVVQCFLIAILLLFLFRLRTVFGLGLFYIALGLFKFMHYFYTRAFAVEILPDIKLSIGSTVLYSGILFSILLIYIREDALEARKVIYALIIFNIIFPIIFYVTSLGIGEAGFINQFNLPESFFTVNIRWLITGTIVLFLDGILLIILYEALSKVSSSLLFRIFSTTLLVLLMNVVLFSFLAFFGTPDFENNFWAGIYSKLIAVPVYSVIFWLYLILIEKRLQKKAGKNIKDIYNLLTYRQKFEKILKEKTLQEKELDHSANLVETLVQTIPDLIWLKDTEGRYLKCNSVYEDYFGYKEERILGKTDRDLMDNKLAQVYRKIELQLMETKQTHKEVELMTFSESGYKGWFEITKTLMYNNDGVIIGILGIGRDITEQKKIIDELEKHQNNLEELVSERSVELLESNKELLEINELFLGREAKIIELKKEIEKLKKNKG